MRAAKSGSSTPGPNSRRMGGNDSERPSREASTTGSLQGSDREMEIHSPMTEFATKYFRYDRRTITIVYCVSDGLGFIVHIMAYFVLTLFVC